MIQANMSKEYYYGVRDALYEYAVHHSGGLEVGSTGKTYKAAVAEVNTMQEESARCVIWRLIRDSKTETPEFPDSMGMPDWSQSAIDTIRHCVCHLSAALARVENPEQRLTLYRNIVDHCSQMERLILGNRPIEETEKGPGTLVGSRATGRALMAQFLTVFAEVFRYTEEFR